MQSPDSARICLHPLCDRVVGDPRFALTRKEREAREYGFCVAEHKVEWTTDPDFVPTSGARLVWPDAEG